MNHKYKIYCFIDNAIGRDAEIVLPVGFALEKYHNCEVKYLFIWDIYEIRIGSPDMILLPNCRGHHMYVEIADYAIENNIKVLALESEGNFATDGSFDFWGYNKDKIIYQEWLTCWTERTKNYLAEIIKPEDRDKLILTGGTGFDKYQYLPFKGRKELLDKYGKGEYSKVIGYAGWAFGKAHGQHRAISFQRIYPDNPEKRFKWVEETRVFVRDVLKQTIEANPDILFILKRHPKEAFESDVTEGLNEMNELIDYSNVLYIRKEEQAHDLINISDIWMGFKTTTASEAWLLNKPTILINKGDHYSLDNLFDGSIKVETHQQLQARIDEYYQKGAIDEFYKPELKLARERIIADSIGFGDGRNHLRASNQFGKSLSRRTSKSKPKLNFRHLRLYVLMHIGRFFYNKALFSKLPYFRKTIYVFENRRLPGFDKLKDLHYKRLTEFYMD